VGYKFFVWNIKHFQGKDKRLNDISRRIKKEKPDVFGIIEFMAKKKVRKFVKKFPEYDFGFTDSKRSIEIIIGCKRNKFTQVVYTQRREFRVKEINLRPGALISFRQKKKTYFDNILFLHTDSGKGKRDYNNRQKMFKKVWKLNKVLKKLKIQKGKSRFITLGDLNTMGRTRNKKAKLSTIKAEDEIQKLKNSAIKAGMKVLEKDQEFTYRSAGGGLKGDLDHVIASNDLKFKTKPHPKDPTKKIEISVKGWIQQKEKNRKNFIKEVSDHCYLVGQVN